MKEIRDKIKEWQDAKLLWEQEGNTSNAEAAKYVIHGLSIALCFVDKPNTHTDKCIPQVDLYKPSRMKTIKSKYQNDPQYAACVRMMESMMHNNQFTPSEMREMAVLASINYEMSHHCPPSFKLTPAVEGALRTLQELREK